MGKKNQPEGCCPDTHAKCFEIILIVGFILSMAALIVNLVLNLWCFKLSLYILILSIVSIAMSAISLILSIILRYWRSDDSFLKKNSSSASGVSTFLLVLVIINILSSIAEEVLYFFIYNYLHIEDQIKNCILNGCDFEESNNLINKLDKAEKTYIKILNKLIKNGGYGIDDDDELEKKKKLLKLLPWIAFNFDIFIQILMLIFIFILKGRINIKNHFGFPPKDNSQSSKSEIIINDKTIDKKLSKKKKKKKEANGIDFSNIESDAATNLKNIKTKKKKKKRNSKKK